MNIFFRKIIVSIAFIINLYLGKLSFNYFFVLAWGPEHYGGMLGVLGRIFIIGCGGGFILAFMPSLLWPQRIWIWCLGFPFNTLLFGSGIVLSILLNF